MADNRRKFTRVPFRVQAEITATDHVFNVEELSNLSIGGCLLPIAADLKEGTACHVKILLSGSSSEMSIRIDGEIKRSQPGTVAVKFIRIDPDSLFHLQNIIRYNSPDPDAVDREITKHPGIT
ncbi:MAG: PilZ domain-containing protein [Deltaproteobacteria bacterium]|nr:PilZ domain-containing protein [Deltaproteobacteria bacterium]MBW2193077.1 PilZ domain-containing protein [Deltaproteobacteria bacterium]